MTDTPPMAPENPCLDCETNCCTNLWSIRVSRNEFERYFSAFPERVRIVSQGPLLELTMEGGTCPHFDRECTAYEGRPIECQLFPHTTHRVHPIGRWIFVTYHHRVVCPIRSKLLHTDTRVRELITTLVQDAYGPDVRPILLNENAPIFRTLRRVFFALTGRSDEFRGPDLEAEAAARA